MRDYVFVDQWRIAAEPGLVSAVVRRVEGWHEWWPSVRRVDRLDGPDVTGPATWRFTFQTRLPYLVIFDVEVVAEDPQVGVEGKITGQFEGRASWGVRMIDGGTLVRFDWRVRPQRRWMRLLSPLARPIFRWNHHSLMVEGGESLAVRMRAQLLEPVVSELRRRPWEPLPIER